MPFFKHCPDLVRTVQRVEELSLTCASQYGNLGGKERRLHGAFGEVHAFSLCDALGRTGSVPLI